MSKIIKTRHAVCDLDDIWYYIALDNPLAADTFLDKLDNCVHILSDNPRMGRLRSELADGIFSFPLDRYVIFYSLIENGIQIVRVLHSARDSMLIAERGGFNV